MLTSLYPSGESSMSDEKDDDITWIEWFCKQKGNEFFVEVEEEYINDDFNLTGLSHIVPYYEEALAVILDEDEDNEMDNEEAAVLESAVHMLYGLIHARYLLTNRGIHALYDKYTAGAFGTCWNVACDSAHVLPVGADVVGHGTANVFCPKCGECYVPKLSKLQQLDGAYFGSSAANICITQFSESSFAATTKPFLPLLYGFRLFPGMRDELKLQRGDVQQGISER